MKRFVPLITYICLLIFFSGPIAHAQSVEKVKGTSVLLNAGDMNLKAGDEYFTLDDMGKKTGLVKISAVKGSHAVAKVVKGNVHEGQSLSLRANKPKSDFEESEGSENIRQIRKSKNAGGILIGYSMDSLSMLAADNQNPVVHEETAGLSGSTIKFKGFYDFNFSSSWTFRVMGGYDGFNGSYSAQSPVINKDGSSTSKLSVSFLTLEGGLLWNLYHKNMTTFWIGGGYSYQYVMSLSSNLYSLQLGASYLNAIFAGVGTNIGVGKTSFIPIYVLYYDFIAGSGVTQTSLNFGLGWGWGF